MTNRLSRVNFIGKIRCKDIIHVTTDILYFLVPTYAARQMLRKALISAHATRVTAGQDLRHTTLVMDFGN